MLKLGNVWFQYAIRWDVKKGREILIWTKDGQQTDRPSPPHTPKSAANAAPSSFCDSPLARGGSSDAVTGSATASEEELWRQAAYILPE